MNRNEKIKLAIGNLHEHDKHMILDYFNYSCAYCGINLYCVQVEFDHIHSVMGDDQDSFWYLGSSPSNIVCSCKKCNRSKSNKVMEDWVREKFERPEEIIMNIYEYQSFVGTPYE